MRHIHKCPCSIKCWESVQVLVQLYNYRDRSSLNFQEALLIGRFGVIGKKCDGSVADRSEKIEVSMAFLKLAPQGQGCDGRNLQNKDCGEHEVVAAAHCLEFYGGRCSAGIFHLVFVR